MKNGNKLVHPMMPIDDSRYGTNGEWTKKIEYGLTKREYFAGLAMQGMLANSCDNQQGVKPYNQMTYAELTELSVKAADALLAELEKS